MTSSDDLSVFSLSFPDVDIHILADTVAFIEYFDDSKAERKGKKTVYHSEKGEYALMPLAELGKFLGYAHDAGGEIPVCVFFFKYPDENPMAVALPSFIDMLNIPVAEYSLFPGILRARFEASDLHAFRITPEKRFQLLFDIQSCLAKHEKRIGTA